MSFKNWKTERIEDILPEEFYKLVDKNRNHVGMTFPVTLFNCHTEERTEDFIAHCIDVEKHSIVSPC